MRFLIWFNGNGIPERYWIPRETGADYELTPCLEPLEPVREHVHVLSGVDNLGARINDRDRLRRPHVRRTQREQVYPGVRHGEHGRSQAWRVFADAHVSRTFRREEEIGVMEARALKKNIRSSPRKMRLVIDLIRGKNANQALQILRFSTTHASIERFGRRPSTTT